MTAMDRRAAHRAEIERDHQLVAISLTEALRRIAREAGPAELDPEHLWQRVEAALEESRRAYRRLNDARINLRAQRGAEFDDTQPLPVSLTSYRHRGNYRGAFRSMTALGALLRRARDMPGDGKHDGAAGIARKLHLRGELWTFERDGSLHVFSTPGSPCDASLARRATTAPAAKPRPGARSLEALPERLLSRQRHAPPQDLVKPGLFVP